MHPTGLITEPESAFERVYCVNLDRRPDRWRRFSEELPADWPFAAPVRFSAVDGQIVKPPPWWRAGRGGWGVYRSFFTIIERCMNEGVQSVLMLEDDALFCGEFSRVAIEWLRHVPADWGMLYLGGQHCRKARQVDQHLVQPQNVNRCHAWALRGPMLREVYLHLNTTQWGKTESGQPHHIDHHLGILHARHYRARDLAVICPPRWFVGQAAGTSNICGKELDDRFWPRLPLASEQAGDQVTRPVVAVLGPYRGGTSCVAGALHRLGVSMGRRWATIRHNPLGTYEAEGLARACRAAFQEWAMTPRTTRTARVAALRRWALARQQDIEGPIGAKHPALCLMVPEILEAWPNTRFISVERPLEDVARSFAATGWCKDPALTQRLPGTLVEARDRALADLPVDKVLRIPYRDVTQDTQAVLRRLAAFTGLRPTREQFQAALDFVRPSMDHSDAPRH